jgi:hypothetical protein
VIVKLDSGPIATRSDWLKGIRSRHRQPFQVTIMRNKQEQVLTMSVGKSKKK